MNVLHSKSNLLIDLVVINPFWMAIVHLRDTIQCSLLRWEKYRISLVHHELICICIRVLLIIVRNRRGKGVFLVLLIFHLSNVEDP